MPPIPQEEQGEPEMDSFYKDELISTSWGNHTLRYKSERKKGYKYLPIPLQTPPLVALLVQSITGAGPLVQEEEENILFKQGTAQIWP